MKRSEINNLKLYPHFKLTNERFPRLLVTRKILNDGSEYFGPVLPKTGARLLLGSVNKLFKLRSCEIDIEKGLPIPCAMFYSKRCLAPCVENICDETEYLEAVELVRLFLRDERKILKAALTKKIEADSEKFDFEQAAQWRDVLLEIENIWEGKRSQYWLEKAIDTWEIIEDGPAIIFNLVTQRGRRILGNRSFLFERGPDETIGEIVGKLFLNFYKVHVPKEIRVFRNFENRKAIGEELSKRFARNVQIFIQNDLTPTTRKGLMQNRFDSVIRRSSRQENTNNIKKYIKKVFNLKRIPNRIEAFDVAHISGKNVVTAKIVWEKGSFLNSENEIWQFENLSEPQAITEAIYRRFANAEADNFPDLVLIDGGKTQINAALKGVAKNVDRNFKIVSVVKPQGKHDQVSHFLDEDLRTIEVENEAAFFFLTDLRDKSHELANSAHGQIRDTDQFYELAILLPEFSEDERRKLLKTSGSIKRLSTAGLDELRSLFDPATAQKIFDQVRKDTELSNNVTNRIVPIRFDEEGGNAKDLQPIV